MSLLSSDALVLRTYQLGETSKIVVLLTRERGKLRAVARGARGKRLRYQSALEPLSQVRVTLYGRQGTELYRLGECELLHSAFGAGQKGLEAALALSYFAELVDAFAPEGEVDHAVYRLVTAVLSALEADKHVSMLTRYMEAWVLRLHGIYPPLNRCAGCGSGLPEGDLHYHRSASGFVCEACRPASGPVLPVSTRTFLQAVFRCAPAEVTVEHPAGSVLGSFHEGLIERHLERRLKSHRVLNEVSREMGRE